MRTLTASKDISESTYDISFPIQIHGDVNVVSYNGVFWDEEKVEWLGNREIKESEPWLHRLTGSPCIPESLVISF